MEAVEVGIREFRENLARYLLRRLPVAITRHGETIGYFIPAPRKRTKEEDAALDKAHARLQKSLQEAGVTEDELIEDFKRWRAARKRK